LYRCPESLQPLNKIIVLEASRPCIWHVSHLDVNKKRSRAGEFQITFGKPSGESQDAGISDRKDLFTKQENAKVRRGISREVIKAKSVWRTLVNLDFPANGHETTCGTEREAAVPAHTIERKGIRSRRVLSWSLLFGMDVIETGRVVTRSDRGPSAPARVLRAAAAAQYSRAIARHERANHDKCNAGDQYDEMALPLEIPPGG
jgi:hypothetical protein